jgi:PadR family transcriptional regulator PadR
MATRKGSTMRKTQGQASNLNVKGALLQALIRGEGYGLELIDRVRERTKGAVVLKQSTVYPALRALEKEGLVESYERNPLPERGGRPRVYYSLTADGRRVALDDQRATLNLFGIDPRLAPTL